MRDLRYALRSLSKSPGFVVVATLCLGLALALNSTTFAILDAMLHPSLPVKDVDRLFQVRMYGRRLANDATAWERFQVLRTGRFYEDIAFFEWDMLAEVVTGIQVDEQPVTRVSSNFFSVLGLEPERGHVLGPGSPENSAVVSHDFWERSLAGRPVDALSISVNGQEYRVVGVVSSGMTFPRGSSVWIAFPPTAERTGVGIRGLVPIVKLQRGVGEERVEAELATLAGRLTLEYGTGPTPYVFALRSIAPRPLELRQIHFAMAGAAALVLLIACANLASLMLVRGAAKRRELALRLSLGAGRRAVIQQLLAEGALLAAAGAVVGLLLTAWAIPILNGVMPPTVRGLGVVPPQTSWRVFAAGLLAAVVALLVFGLWPALPGGGGVRRNPWAAAPAIAPARAIAEPWRQRGVDAAEVGTYLVPFQLAVPNVRPGQTLTRTRWNGTRRPALPALPAPPAPPPAAPPAPGTASRTRS